MKYILSLFLLIGSVSFSYAQADSTSILMFDEEQQAVIKVCQSLFDAMRTENGMAARNVFHEEASLRTTMVVRGKNTLHVGSVEKFIESIDKEHEALWDERILGWEVKIDRTMANVWAPYEFWFGDKFSHCGVNNIQLFKDPRGWRIISIVDTRQNEKCEQQEDLTTRLNTFMDAWHKAAAEADEDAFFGSIAENGIYLGTDATEKWTRQEFMDWGMKYFTEREVAWAFTPLQRSWYFSGDRQIAWFEEKLDTWMGECRGSGVIRINSKNIPEIMHYNLTLPVPNEKIDAFLDLMGVEKKK